MDQIITNIDIIQIVGQDADDCSKFYSISEYYSMLIKTL